MFSIEKMYGEREFKQWNVNQENYYFYRWMFNVKNGFQGIFFGNDWEIKKKNFRLNSNNTGENVIVALCKNESRN